MANSIKKFASYASITLFFYGLATTSVQAQVNTDPYTFTYTTTLVPLIDRDENQRRRVPEPSALLGLMTVFGLFATQRQLMKRGQRHFNFKIKKEEN
ncbi:PEP-CTERM sorting domain-containing protein [Scytonema sp. UIC 10036]|uniref:PEP-CTERM sorting domain-containing protein n=1 Tax=Scytonema sp. UIC 10036 TaxID=2304196 RepID=UPI0012DA4D61|nr:PEP-CTERM sorting domain-containing protein [Scytonema sp. UIC 10036]MUH00177.1 PEP-CTERM sorting domain-containing protein [Scytonema sp. UIC 10036]